MNFKIIIYVVLVVLLIVNLIIFKKYNTLVKLQNRVKKAKANIEICLKKRFDLIPNLVECVKSYSKYESETLEEIIALRNNYKEQKELSIKDTETINNRLNQYLAIVESYPELKANDNYMNLQKELRNIEDSIERTRRIYNDEVTRYNTLIETVPSNIIASIFAFKKTELFGASDEERENINLSF